MHRQIDRILFFNDGRAGGGVLTRKISQESRGLRQAREREALSMFSTLFSRFMAWHLQSSFVTCGCDFSSVNQTLLLFLPSAAAGPALDTCYVCLRVLRESRLSRNCTQEERVIEIQFQWRLVSVSALGGKLVREGVERGLGE